MSKKKKNKNSLGSLLISLMLAILLWAFAVTNTDQTITSSISNISVNYINLREDLVIDNPVSTVNIKVYGRTSQVAKLKKSDIKATVDMSAITEDGLYTLRVNIQGLSDSINVTEISNQYIAVNVSNYISRENNFSVDFSGSLPEGFSVIGHTSDSTNIHLSGSQSLISKVAEIKGTLSLNDETNDFNQQVALYAYDDNGSVVEGIQIEPNIISVNVTVGLQKQVPIEIQTENTLNEELILNGMGVLPDTVTIKGPVSIINSIEAINTSPLDLSLISGSGAYEVELAIPDGVTYSSNQKAAVSIEITELTTKTVIFDSIQIRNCAANLECDLSQIGQIEITVGAEASVAETLLVSDILVYVDLSGLSEGTHEVILQYSLPIGVKLISLSQQTVKIILK